MKLSWAPRIARSESSGEPFAQLHKGSLALLSEGRGACGIGGNVPAQGCLHGGLLRGREVGNGPLKELLEFVICEQVVCRAAEILEPLERELGAAARTAALVGARDGARLPYGEGESPAERGAAGLVAVRLLEELHHRSLRGIVRIGCVARDPSADRVDAGVERPEDGPEGRTVAIGNPREEAIELVRRDQGSVTPAAGSRGAITGAGGRCCEQHQGQRNRRKDQTEKRHGGVLLPSTEPGDREEGPQPAGA